MSNESRHTPTPYTVNGFGGSYSVIARMQPHEVAISVQSEHRDEIATAAFIVEACNAYDALKAQNEELVELLRACSPHVHLVASRNPKLELPRALCNAIDAVLARTTKEPA